MSGVFQIVLKSRLAQIICCLSPNITIWANRLCAGMGPNDKQMYASLLLDFLMDNISEENNQLVSDLTEEQIYVILDKIAELTCIRYNLCVQDESTILTSTGNAILWTDLNGIEDVSGVPYQWNN